MLRCINNFAAALIHIQAVGDGVSRQSGRSIARP
jgi:hypothetical protein